MQFPNPAVSPDRNVDGIAVRRQQLGALADEGALAITTLVGGPGGGRITRDGDGFRVWTTGPTPSDQTTHAVDRVDQASKDHDMTNFGNASTTDEVLEGIDLTGRRVVITGAATGLGRESARAMAAHGASVTVLARSAERAAEAATAVEQLVPGATVESGVVDLGDLASIRAFADSYLPTHDAIDVLINNAGVMACPFGHTADGFETQFGTNHLGHFALTALLAPTILRGDSPRVITLSSAGHSRSNVDLDDPNFEHTDYSPWTAYGRSKSANALFARELANRYGAHGLLSFSVHPGGIVTDLGRHLTDELLAEMTAVAEERAAAAAAAGEEAVGLTWKSVEAGAATQVWGATAPGIADHNGTYLADCGLGVRGGNPGANGFVPYIEDDETAAKLWDLSEQLTGISFPAP